MTTVATDPSKATCEVYWIRRSNHIDIFSEGYVGISTKGATRRFVEHRSAANNGSRLPVHCAIRKYGDVIVETILIGTLECCQDVEFKLRPEPYIGWNLASGGGSIMLGFKHSEDTKKKISQNNGSRGRVYSEEERERKREIALARNFQHSEDTLENLRQKALRRVKEDGGEQIKSAYERAAWGHKFRAPWENPNADKSTWLFADQIFQMFCEGEIKYRVAKKLNISEHKLIAIYKRFKEGWNPGLCPEWQTFKNNYI